MRGLEWACAGLVKASTQAKSRHRNELGLELSSWRGVEWCHPHSEAPGTGILGVFSARLSSPLQLLQQSSLWMKVGVSGGFQGSFWPSPHQKCPLSPCRHGQTYQLSAEEHSLPSPCAQIWDTPLTLQQFLYKTFQLIFLLLFSKPTKPFLLNADY